MIGETNRLESDLICFLKFTAQETRIQDTVTKQQQEQTGAMQQTLDDLKAKLAQSGR